MGTKFDKDEYRQKKKAEKDHLFGVLDTLTSNLVKDEGSLKKYFNLQAVLDKYSVSNTILISGKLENASRLKGREDWEEQGVNILENMESVQIFEPYEYKTKDEKIRKDYRVKEIFDISQTDAEKNKRIKELSERDLLKALIKESPVEIEGVTLMETNLIAEYSHRNQRILVRRGIEPKVFFRAVTKEIAYAHFALNDFAFDKESYSFQAETVSYMLCKKYGYEVDEIILDTPESLRKAEPKEIRNELSKIKIVYCEIGERIAEQLERESKQRKREENER